MIREKKITIISPNTLVCLGLKSIISDFFNFESVTFTSSYASLSEGSETPPDLYIITPEIYLMHEYFQSIKNKVVILLDKKQFTFNDQSSLHFLDITLSETELADNLNLIISGILKNKKSEITEGLSLRETEVLQLVAKGYMNKQIADSLSISMHTVISHRKNLTRKLGINTVSGLTIYALLNGLITFEEIQEENLLRPD